MNRFLAAVILLSCCPTVPAAVLQVGGGGYASIQAAIDDSNDGDTITVVPGSYEENIDFGGKAITVRSTDPNDANIVAATIIDGSNPDDPNFASVVRFHSGEDINSVLSGFTITGGTGSWIVVAWEYKGARWNRCGGGVLCYDMSAPTITKNVFTGNLAGQGGGVYVYGDPVNLDDPSDPSVHIAPIISDNVFVDNQALKEHGFSPPDDMYPNNDHGDGGAIVTFQGCDAIITGNVIIENYAFAYGGGMHLRQWCNGLIEDNEIVGNQSLLGAGLHLTYTSAPTVRANLIKANRAGSLGGGGIYVYSQSDPLIEGNLITENDCTSGSGIAVYYESEPVIRNNLIVKNRKGAGIRIRGNSNAYVTHNTIADNDGGINGGSVEVTATSDCTLENNIIADTVRSYGIFVEEGSSAFARYNDVWNNAIAEYSPVMGDQTGVNGNISRSPEFVDADSNDYHLHYSSPCINTGDPCFVAGGLTDYDGKARKMGQYVDIGADEAWPVWNVTRNGRYAAIQDAINDANERDHIIATRGRYYENLDFAGRNVRVESADPNNWHVVEQTIIDGNGLDSVVLAESGEDANCVLAGFAITGGAASSGYGGGVRIRNYSGPTVRRNIIAGNTAQKGAGICLYHSTSKVLNNIIASNTTTALGQGGGVMIIDCLEDPNAVVAGNIIVGNEALYGGGIRIQNSDGAILVNNTIAFNRASWKGIGIYGEGNHAVNSILWGHGGGVDQDLYDCTAAYSCTESGVSGIQNIATDPCFIDAGYWDDAGSPGDLTDDFFVMGDYHLQGDSGCLDAADTGALPESLAVDIDGENRVFNAVADIGADEMVTSRSDFNEDGAVDSLDLSAFAADWLVQGPGLLADMDETGIVDWGDFVVFSAEWGWMAGWRQ